VYIRYRWRPSDSNEHRVTSDEHESSDHLSLVTHHSSLLYISLSELTIFSLAARQAGKKPPKAPMASENTTPAVINCGVKRKLNRTSENVLKFIVPVGLVRNRLKTRNVKITPSTPPATHSMSASITNETRIERRENPIARSVPISRVLAET